MPPFDAELIPNRNTARIIFLRNREHENSIGLQQAVRKFHRSKHFNLDECMRIKKLLNRKDMIKLNWTTKKPKFDRECFVICASKISGGWNYNIYQIQKAEFEDTWYWGWFDNGEEVGDITDMHAEKYAVIELLK